MFQTRSTARASDPARTRAQTPRILLSRIASTALGMPSRPFASGTSYVSGRPQATWGRWWGERPRLLSLLALVAIAWTTVSLVWRVGWSWHGASRWLWGILLVTELYGVWNLSMLTW